MKESKTGKIILKIRIHKKLFKIDLSYFLENWGAPFIILFMVYLIVAAGYLAYGLENVANNLAVYAYYFLVIGVVLQFVCYLKYSGEDKDNG